MKKSYYMLIAAMVTSSLLSGCLDNGSTADPPMGFTANAEDGRVLLTWTGSPGVDYWLFTATDPSLTAFNWTGLPNAHAYIKVATPFYMCGLYSGSQYYFAMNGRKDGGPGGPSSPTISATPYNASANTWMPNLTSLIQNVYGLGYASLTTCANYPTSATGSFAAVGAGSAIFTSSDGKNWVDHTLASPISTDLYAVTGYAASLNNPNTLRWVAVGAGGASVYSADGGTTWTAGNSSGLTLQPLRSLAQSAGTFVAVGDTGTILSSTDGTNWTSHTSASVTTNNLNGVTHGSIYVAVGNSGTILTSSDGANWAAPTSWTPSLSFPALRKVAAFGNIIVAVGDSGTIVTSKDNGASWAAQSLGTMNLVGVTAESHFVSNDIVDSWLGVVPSVQFVAVDGNGNTYTTISSASSTNGQTWIVANNTNINLTNALVSSGFGYVAAGNVGATAYAF